MSFSNLPTELRLSILKIARANAFHTFRYRFHEELRGTLLRWERDLGNPSSRNKMSSIRHASGAPTVIHQYYTVLDIITRRVIEVISSRSVSCNEIVFHTWQREIGSEWVKVDHGKEDDYSGDSGDDEDDLHETSSL
jgi:hypothetical protein